MHHEAPVRAWGAAAGGVRAAFVSLFVYVGVLSPSAQSETAAAHLCGQPRHGGHSLAPA